MANQFATLETPEGEPGVLAVDATEPAERQCARIVDWLGLE